MEFTAPVFLYLFLPAVLVGYHVVPRLLPGRELRHAVASAFLFAASVFVYVWGCVADDWRFVFVLLGSMLANYAFARLAESRPRAAAWYAVGFCLGILLWFKVGNFLAVNLSELWVVIGGESFATQRNGRMPMAVSFFTFQALSYVLDVCRKDIPAERNVLQFGLYVFLFPHLFAGPIVRYADLAGQLRERPVGLDRFAEGCRRLIVGLAKKLLLADTFAEVADAAFRTPAGDLSASAAWLGVVCYALQIYFDFGGYTDMAVGLGKLFGFDFAENFRHPYSAASVTDFWRRWHLSLSTWFRDYLYIPLGGNRGGRWKTYRNLLVVFLLCGLWHGAAWTFVLWGLMHGGFLILERAGFGTMLERMWAPMRHLYTLLSVTAAWVLFRATGLEQAAGVYAAMLGFTGGTTVAADLWNPKLLVALPVGVLACLPVVPWLLAKKDGLTKRMTELQAALVEAVAAPVGVLALAALLVAVSVQVVATTYSPFIYIKF